VIAIVQLVFALVVCGVVVWWQSMFYIGMAVLVLAVAIAVLAQRERVLRKMLSQHGLEPEGTLISLGISLLLALGLAVLWPMLPVILWREPRASSDGKRSTSGPSAASNGERRRSEGT